MTCWPEIDARGCGRVEPHDATRSASLDWFCCFSSAAALAGSPGQGVRRRQQPVGRIHPVAAKCRTRRRALSPGGAGPRSARAPVLPRPLIRRSRPTKAPTRSRRCCGTTVATPATRRAWECPGSQTSPSGSCSPSRSVPRIPGIPTPADSSPSCTAVRRTNGSRGCAGFWSPIRISVLLRRSIDPDRPLAEYGIDSLGKPRGTDQDRDRNRGADQPDVD